MCQARTGHWGCSDGHRPRSLPRGGGFEWVGRGSEREAVLLQACSLKVSPLPLHPWYVCPAASSSKGCEHLGKRSFPEAFLTWLLHPSDVSCPADPALCLPRWRLSPNR